jgi:hypothetical protein
MDRHYQYWQEMLSAQTYGLPREDWPTSPINEPQCGFYRWPGRSEVKGVVAIFDHPQLGRIAVAISSDKKRRRLDAEAMDKVWTWIAGSPISEETFRYFEANGQFASDIPSREIGIGHNQPPPDQALIDEVEITAGNALSDIKNGIVDQASADRAANWRDRIIMLEKHAKQFHDDEKAPHLAAGKAIDDKWRSTLTRCREVTQLIRNALTPYLKQQQDAARQAAGEGVEVRPRAGTGKRRTGLRTTVRAKVSDWQAAAQFFADRPELRHVVQRLANEAIANGLTVPGCEKEEETTAL